MQAVLIIAHRDVDQVIQLANILAPRFEVYIHFDKKLSLTNQQTSELKSNRHVHHFSKIDVHWGGWSIGQVAVDLMKWALKNPDISYLHLISGQDWPVQPIDKIYQFYEKNNQIYLQHYNVVGKKKTGEPMIWWQKYYFPYDRMNRRTFYGKIYHRLNLIVQTICRVNKFKKLNIHYDIYSGANWCDIPRDAAEYALAYFDNHPNLRKMLATGCFSDEFWLQTILCNSAEYRNRLNNNIHRYILMEHQHGSRPAILDMSNVKQIESSDAQFARKFVSPYSDELLKHVNKNVKE